LTGEEKTIPTFEIELAEGVRIALMASHQLTKQLPPLFGKRVVIIREVTKKVGQRQINQFAVSDVSSL
jgi:hypothetical protein